MIFEGIGLSPVTLVAFPGRALGGGVRVQQKENEDYIWNPTIIENPRIDFLWYRGLSPTSTLPPKENGLCIIRTHSKML